MTSNALWTGRLDCNAVRNARGSRGFALIMSLLFLVIIALLMVSMLRGLGLQGRLAGNTLEKQRSLQAAQAALQYGEWWVSQGTAGTGQTCSAMFNANNAAAVMACVTPLTAAGAVSLPWTIGGVYTPTGMTIRAGGGLTADGTGIAGDVNYSAAPQMHIAYLGIGPDSKSLLYQVTAAGYGGSGTTASVVQIVYSMATKISDIGGP